MSIVRLERKAGVNKVYFLMAIHFHQPVGNFNHVFEKVYKNSYQPFIETLQEFPDIKLTLHFSGCLLEWLLQNKPRFLDEIKHLAKQGQIEIMTGGFYEPILPVIPCSDQRGQILMLSDFIKRHFQYQPKGAWIAERVWEPSLPFALSESGVKYAVLDDSHLKYSGLSEGELHGYYMTEDKGRAVAVFASDKKLRYLIPFGQPGQVIDYLKSIAGITGGLAAIYGDDAEKFGEWPDTYEWVYEKRWLYNFFLALRHNNSWIKTAHLGEYLQQNEPLGRAYVPAASYHEMGEWALPADSAEKFEALLDEIKQDGRDEDFLPYLRGGFWRNFLTKYPEANQMYKKMLRVSGKIERLEDAGPLDVAGARQKAGQAEKLKQAKQELYRGQCNCAYWHGVFGGLYLYHLRSAVWEHLIKAETLVDEIVKFPKTDWLDCEIGDFDNDGYDEAIVANAEVSLFFDGDEGGSLPEFDYKPKSTNIVNTLARRKEAYHARLLAQSAGDKREEGAKTIHERDFQNVSLARNLFYDWYRRSCLLDHFLGPGTTIENFSKCQYEELGDFINQPYKIKDVKNGVVLTRDGEAGRRPLRVTKTVTIKKDSADIRALYQITNVSDENAELWFGSEFNFSLTNDEVFEQLFAEKGLSLKDAIAGLNIQLGFSKPTDAWRFPIKTISQSESDIEENYQSTAVLLHWKFSLSPGKSWDAEISLAF